MNSKAIPILLVLIMLTVASGVSAEGQPKVGICHLDEYGNYQLISVADPAVQAHMAHGDAIPGTNGVDANCEPQSQYPAGCFKFTAGLEGEGYVKLNGGTQVEDIGGEQVFFQANCSDANITFRWTSPQYAIWAVTWFAADVLCQQQLPGYEYVSTGETPTPGLYRCQEPE